MAHLYTTYDASTGNGRVYTRAISATAGTERWLQGAINRRPVMFPYKRRKYVVGQFPRLLVYNEYGQLTPGGIIAPQSAPVVTTGTFSGGSEGEFIGYINFRHKVGSVVVQQSNLSAASQTLTLTGTGRSWTVPATAPDERVTHIAGWGIVDPDIETGGGVPALIWERPIGVTSVTENVLTGEFGETAPVYIGNDNVSIFDPNARGVPPYTAFAEVYHDSTYYAGDPFHPERIYRSRLFEPESVNAVDSLDDAPSGYLETLDGEAVTGLKRWKDLLLVTCLKAVYGIQGFDSGDLQIIKLTDFYGCAANASLVKIGPNGDVYGAGQDTVWRYDGTFHDCMEGTVKNYWRDTYRANPTTFANATFAAEDRLTKTYIIKTPAPAEYPGLTFKWVGHWVPTLTGQQPWWTFDIRARVDSVMGNLFADENSTFSDLYTGSCDGFIRKENDYANADDDGDEYGKRLYLLSKHFFFGDQCGDDAHGRKYTQLDVFLKSENVAVTVSLYGGDDSASTAASPQWAETIPAGAVTSPVPKVAKTSTHLAVSRTNGKGVSLAFEAATPTDVSLRGWAVYHTDGRQERLLSE